jgi:hypothetical protein
MRFLPVPKGQNLLWGWIYLTLGQALFISAFVLFLLNIFFSAIGLMEFMGANITYSTANIWFPFIPQFLDGGRGGLFLGIVAGIMTSAVQIRLLIAPKDTTKKGVKSTIDKTDWFIGISILISVYDYLSTHYSLMGGKFFDFSSGLVEGSLLFAAVFLVTLILFSIGSEMFMVYGMEMMITNWNSGSRAWNNVLSKLKNGTFNIFGEGDGETETDNLPEQEIDNRPIVDKRRGRPPKNLEERVDF